MLTTKVKWIVAICLLGCFFNSVAFSCQYTVRDVGFTDIGSIPYRLYCYIQDDTPEYFTATFKQISYVALMDSNVDVEIVNVDQQDDHPSMTYLHFWEIRSFPAAVLVSPKGRSLVLPISDPNKPFKEAIWSALESVVSSPKRQEIVQHIVKAYCVILLIQGENDAENKRVQKAVTGAIEEISRIMSQMTKTIEEPPRLAMISPESFSEEKILLWSLGVNENDRLELQSQLSESSIHYKSSIYLLDDEPYVAVLYGRGRQIGPLLKGEKITTNAVFNLLSVIGSACECGLDKRWTLGMMFPLRWGEKIRSEVVKLLGFDAESPMVKMEISQILSLGHSVKMEDEGVVEGTLHGYKEEVVEFESSTTVAMVSPAQFREMDSAESATFGTGAAFQMTLFIVGCMFFLILAGGVFILLRSRRKLS